MAPSYLYQIIGLHRLVTVTVTVTVTAGGPRTTEFIGRLAAHPNGIGALARRPGSVSASQES